MPPDPPSPLNEASPSGDRLAGRLASRPAEVPAEPPGFNSAPRLYLDQMHWVGLLRDTTSARGLRQRLSRAVAAGEIVVCLSASHYIETWHRGKWESRWDLARLMWDTSRLVTLAPLHALVRSEVARALLRAGHRVAPGSDRAVHVAFGVNHAFASPTGRLALAESVGEDGGNGPSVPFADLPEHERELYLGGRTEYEWFSLAGMPADMRPEAIDLRTSRRSGVAFVADETALGVALRDHTPGVDLGVELARHDLQHIWHELLNACGPVGTDPNVVVADGPAGLRRFIRSMPAFGLMHDLRALRHENPQQRWVPNDRQDLLALSVAVPYCDAVVTEGQWAHLCRRAGAADRYGTAVTSDLAAALAALDL